MSRCRGRGRGRGCRRVFGSDEEFEMVLGWWFGGFVVERRGGVLRWEGRL